MQCSELKISNLCELSAKKGVSKDLTCGSTQITYNAYYNKEQLCGKAVVHCSSRPPYTATAVIAIDRFGFNETDPSSESTTATNNSNSTIEVEESSSNKSTSMEISTSLIEDIQKADATEEADDPFAYISAERMISTTTTLKCNDKGEWVVNDLEENVYNDVTELYCIVGKVDN